MSVARKLIRNIIDASKKSVIQINYQLDHYKEVIWLVGDGRSGTTWVADILNYDKRYREMFEPFHPEFVSAMRFIEPHQYIRPDDFNGRIEQISAEIFSGKFTHRRVDAENRALCYKGLLIKDIFANLSCYSASLKFPQVKPVLLIRNPFAVALSKYKKKDWFWATEPLALLNQPALYEDYLAPFEQLIRETSAKNDYLLNQLLIWSIINYVPLRQFDPDAIHVCFYENIYTDPHREIGEILKFVSGINTCSPTRLGRHIIDRPSRVTGTESNLLSGTSPVTSWKREIPPHLIEQGLEILQCFGFDHLYDERCMPNPDALKRIRESS